MRKVLAAVALLIGMGGSIGWVAQIQNPSSSAPTGAASGDLGGTYPSPTVVSVADVTTGVLPSANGGSLLYYGIDSGAANAYVVTTTPALTAYVAGQIVCFIPLNAASAASTVNVSGLGLKNWMKATTGSPIALGATGDMPTTTTSCARYDGTQFVILSPASTVYTGGSLAAGCMIRGNSNNQIQCSSGILSSGGTIVTTYNSLATAGVGLSAIYASPSTITIGSGTSIGNTSLCSTALCPAGTYIINTYLDITTACGTSGTYTVNFLYTDDQGAKSVVANINGTGAVPATGALTTTSTANFGEDTQVVRTTGVANNGLGSINYSTTAVACGTAGPMVGNLYLSVTRVQ